MKTNYESELTPEVREKMKFNLVYVGIFSIVMLFAGFTSAYIVSMGDTFWLKASIPPAFIVSTVVIVCSSFTFILAIHFAKKLNTKALKALISITMILGFAFVYFQLKGYSQLMERGVHFTGSRILVNEGRYGDFFTLKYKGNQLEVDGNHYYLRGKDANQSEMKAISKFAKQFESADELDGLKKVINYGNEFVLYYNYKPLALLNNELMLPDGSKLGSHDLYRLKKLAEHLRDGRGDFFVKGEMGTDFHIYFKGEELGYKNRTLIKPNRQALRPYELIKATNAADTASSFLYIITILHLLHIIVTILFMIKTVIFSFSGKYSNGDTVGLRATGIFWHFLGLLWVFLLLFLVFIH